MAISIDQIDAINRKLDELLERVRAIEQRLTDPPELMPCGCEVNEFGCQNPAYHQGDDS